MPFLVIECKAVSEGVRSGAAVRQLAAYYRGSGAVFGVLTNGCLYRFFGGFEVSGEMDSEPFFEVDMEGLSGPELEGLRVFSKESSVGAACVWAARRWTEGRADLGECETREGIERAALAVVREALRGAGACGRVWVDTYTADSNIFYVECSGKRKRLCGLAFRRGGCRIGIYAGQDNDRETGRVGSVAELRGRVGEIVRRVVGQEGV